MRNYVKTNAKLHRIGAIIEFIETNGFLPSIGTIMRILHISRTTAYALTNEVVAKGNAKGVPYENGYLQMRTVLGNEKTNQKTDASPDLSGSCRETQSKADD